MEEVCFLAPAESPRIDPDRIEELRCEVGALAAEDMVCRAMEDIALRLCHLHALAENGRRDELRKGLQTLGTIAEQIGLTGITRIAGDVLTCIAHDDPVAEAATLARLTRTGEQSLAALWDLQGVTV